MAWGRISDGVTGVAGERTPDVPRETVFDILSNQRRRHVLHCLRQSDEPVPIRKLSETIAAWENDCAETAVKPKQRKRVYTALHQTHLPKMVQSGVAIYDSDRGLVELTPKAAALEAYLDLDAETGPSMQERLVLAVGAGAGVVGLWLALGLPVLDAVPGWGYLLAVSALILVGWVARRLEGAALPAGEVGSPTSVGDPASSDD